MKGLAVLLSGFVLLLSAGCKPSVKSRDITPLARKQAASLGSEADFAATLKDLRRAEGLYQKAAGLCPDEPSYWENLGIARRKLGETKGARTAYGEALAVYRENYRRDRNPADVLHQMWLLSLLGRNDEAARLLQKGRVDHPADPRIRQAADPKWLEEMRRNPGFKAIAL